MEDIKVQICLFGFDILYLNGKVFFFSQLYLLLDKNPTEYVLINPTVHTKALVHESFRARRDLLHSAFHEVEGEFAFARYSDTNDVEVTLLPASVYI